MIVALGVAFFVGLAGCATEQDTGAAPVGSIELEKSLTDRLIQAGTPPRRVACSKDLPREPGRTVRCEVQFSPTNVVTAVLTTTGSSGGDYEITGPELSEEQLAARVGSSVAAQALVCDSGIKGTVGNWTRCEFNSNGATSVQIVEVKAISGLTMDLAVTPSLPKAQIEERLRRELSASGQTPESAECAQDLLGVTGTTLTCVVTTGGDRETHTLTVTGVSGGQVNYTYLREDSRRESGGPEKEDRPGVGEDECQGCPG